MKKRFLSLALVLSLVFAVVPAGMAADYTATFNDDGTLSFTRSDSRNIPGTPVAGYENEARLYNFGEGIGNLNVTLTVPAGYRVSVGKDHLVDADAETYPNEYASDKVWIKSGTTITIDTWMELWTEPKTIQSHIPRCVPYSIRYAGYFVFSIKRARIQKSPVYPCREK